MPRQKVQLIADSSRGVALQKHPTFRISLRVSRTSYRFRTMVQSQGYSPLTIGKLAEAGGVGVETIRFYQRKGLLGTPARNGAIRRYGIEDVRRLRFIRSAQTAGFTLEEIKELLELDATEDRARARVLASARIEALDRRIAELEAARDALSRLASECSSKRSGRCPILASFGV